MNQKKLWKIEEIWKRDIEHKPNFWDFSNIQKNYKNGVSIYYKKFHQVDVFDFSLSQEPVFSDTYGSYRGLEKQQLIIKEKPIYLFDNHNEIIYPLVELYENQKEQSFSVLHIDAHPDNALFQTIKPDRLALENISAFVSQTRISDFFDALSETLIIKDIQRVISSSDFKSFKTPKEPYVLSLDIDIFGPEGDFIDLETKLAVIKKAWGGAQAICIATSPGFIDQGFAKEIITVFYNI